MGQEGTKTSSLGHVDLITAHFYGRQEAGGILYDTLTSQYVQLKWCQGKSTSFAPFRLAMRFSEYFDS